MSRYRFALHPKWIVSHVLVALLVVGLCNLGVWQLRRLDDKRTNNDLVVARLDEAEAPVSTLLGAGDAESVVGGVEYRRVNATGTYLRDDEVLVANRSRDGAPGSWVLTPLDLGNGRAVVVNRGWISNTGGLDAVPSVARAPEGKVTVTGIVRPSETRGSIGPKDPTTGTLDMLARADIARLDQQVGADLLPGWIQMTEQVPPRTVTDPKPVPRPSLDEGPHLSYAFQWFFFMTIALVGYPLILRRRAREIELEALEGDGS